MSLWISSLLLAVLWVIQVVATVAEPPTSDPRTPDIAVRIVESIGVSYGGLTRTGLLRNRLGEALLQPLDHMRLDSRRLNLPDSLHRLLVYCVMHHHHVVQLCEGHRIVRSTYGSVFVQHALDDARIENPHLAQQREPANLEVELVEVLRPPSGNKFVVFASHGLRLLAVGHRAATMRRRPT